MLLPIMVLAFALFLNVIVQRYQRVTYDELLDIIAKVEPDSETDVIFEVNGEKIYGKTVDDMVESRRLSAQNAFESGMTDKNEFEEETARQEIIIQAIRNIIVFQEAEKLGLTVSYEEAYAKGLEAYNMALESEQKQNFIDYMKDMDMTEEEYLKNVGMSYQKMLTREKFYEHFVEEKKKSYEGKVVNHKEIDADYEEYVKELISKADIVYK